MRDVYCAYSSSITLAFGPAHAGLEFATAVWIKNFETKHQGRNFGDSLQVNDIWYSAVPGDEVTKTAAKESLAREWEARFRVPSTDYEEVKVGKKNLGGYVCISCFFSSVPTDNSRL